MRKQPDVELWVGMRNFLRERSSTWYSSFWWDVSLLYVEAGPAGSEKWNTQLLCRRSCTPRTGVCLVCSALWPYVCCSMYENCMTFVHQIKITLNTWMVEFESFGKESLILLRLLSCDWLWHVMLMSTVSLIWGNVFQIFEFLNLGTNLSVYVWIRETFLISQYRPVNSSRWLRKSSELKGSEIW